MDEGGGGAGMLRWPFVGREPEVDAAVHLLVDGGGGGLVLAGGPGVGKTRMAGEVSAELGRRQPGTVTEWAVATAPAAGIAFAATAGWFGRGATGALQGETTAGLLRTLAAELAERAPDGRLVVAVDDAHHLDAASALLVHHLVLTGTATALLTVRQGAPAPEPVLGLWKDGHLRRMELAPLDEAATADVLCAALGGPVDGAVVQALWRVSAGNLLYLRELATAATGTGALVRQRGRWLLRGPLPTSPSLTELVEDRLGARSAEEGHALDLVAMGEPLALPLLEELVGRPVVAALEGAGLVAVDGDGRRQTVRTAHPLHGEVLRARCGAVRARVLAGELARAVEGYGLRRAGDDLRHAVWVLDSGGRCEPGEARTAALAALRGGDAVLAGRLAEAACVADPTDLVATFALAEALLRQHRPHDCLPVFDRVPALPEPDETLVRRARAFVLWWAFGRADEAVAELERMAATTEHPESRMLLCSSRAALACHQGDVGTSLRLCAEVLAGASSPALRWEATERLAMCLALSGRGDAAASALAEAPRPAGLQGRPDLLVPPTVDLSTAALAVGAFAAGRLPAMAAMAEGARRDGLDLGSLPLRRLGCTGLGLVALHRGALVEAAGWFDEAVALLEPTDEDGTRALVSGGAARVLVLGGQLAAARRLVDDARRAAHPLLRWFDPVLDHAAALCRAAGGQRQGACDDLLAAAESARGRGQVAFVLDMLLDACLLGAGGKALALLDELGSAAEGPLPALAAAYARARAGGEAPAVAAVSADAEAAGLVLLAARMAADAVSAARRAGDRGAVTRATVRCRRLLERCAGLAAWVVADRLADDPLTAREREVATLAAAGWTNRQVAEHLYLSVRTVESHLDRVFAKLAVHRRADLAPVLGVPDGGGAGAAPGGAATGADPAGAW